MTLLFIAFIFIIIVYIWTKKRYSYWSSKGVEGPKPFPIVGNFGTVMAAKEHHDHLFQRIYNDYCNTPYVGIYQSVKPVLLVRDPEIIKQILINDFSVFRDRGLKSAYPHNDHAFSSEGESWKALRSLLSQSFTPKKLKSRIPLFEQCASDFQKYVDDALEHGSDFELQYDLIWRYNFHISGVILFGLNIQALSTDTERKDFKHILDELFVPSLYSRIIMYADQIIPGFQKVVSTLKIDPRVNRPSEFLGGFVNNVIEGRVGQPDELYDYTEQIKEIIGKKKAFTKQDNHIEFERSEMVLVNQVLVMYIGLVETANAFLSFFIHELAYNQEIQDRLLKEILEVTKKENGKITYESLNDMVYMDMVLNEVLRIYSTAFMQRQAVSDYEFPSTKLKIEKGTTLIIPLLALHKDPKYFEDPEVFNPERFSPQNMENIQDFSYLPFGDGPRNCVGMKSAKLQLKYGVAAILPRFKFEPCEKSTRQLQFHITGITLNRTKGIWLKVSKRTTQHNH